MTVQPVHVALIIDTDFKSTLHAQKIFDALGWRYHKVSSGMQAITLVKQDPYYFSLIVCEGELKDVGVFSQYANVKALAAERMPKIINFTSLFRLFPKELAIVECLPFPGRLGRKHLFLDR